jgi:hypothetical protein
MTFKRYIAILIMLIIIVQGACSIAVEVADASQKARLKSLRTELATSPLRLGVSDEQYAERTHRAGMELLLQHHTAEAVDLAIEAASIRPSMAMYRTVETLSSLAGVQKDTASNQKGMRWLRNKAGKFGQSPRFLGNLAHVEELAGEIEQSISTRQQIVTDFPDTPESAGQLDRITRLFLKQGDRVAARATAMMTLDGKYPTNYKATAQRILDVLDN